MKTILTLCAVILLAGLGLSWQALRMPDRYGTFSDAPQIQVADVVQRPAEFRGKTVVIEGTVTKQCKKMGCFFYFASQAGDLRVDLEDIAMNAPMRDGHRARVEGQLVPYGDAYQFYASAVEFQ